MLQKELIKSIAVAHEYCDGEIAAHCAPNDNLPALGHSPDDGASHIFVFFHTQGRKLFRVMDGAEEEHEHQDKHHKHGPSKPHGPPPCHGPKPVPFFGAEPENADVNKCVEEMVNAEDVSDNCRIAINNALIINEQLNQTERMLQYQVRKRTRRRSKKAGGAHVLPFIVHTYIYCLFCEHMCMEPLLTHVYLQNFAAGLFAFMFIIFTVSALVAFAFAPERRACREMRALRRSILTAVYEDDEIKALLTKKLGEDIGDHAPICANRHLLTKPEPTGVCCCVRTVLRGVIYAFLLVLVLTSPFLSFIAAIFLLTKCAKKMCCSRKNRNEYRPVIAMEGYPAAGGDVELKKPVVFVGVPTVV